MADPAQISAAGENKSAPSIILKFITAFDLRTTTFCAWFSKKKVHNFDIDPVRFSWPL